jgi:hypothetical protein
MMMHKDSESSCRSGDGELGIVILIVSFAYVTISFFWVT